MAAVKYIRGQRENLHNSPGTAHLMLTLYEIRLRISSGRMMNMILNFNANCPSSRGKSKRLRLETRKWWHLKKLEDNGEQDEIFIPNRASRRTKRAFVSFCMSHWAIMRSSCSTASAANGAETIIESEALFNCLTNLFSVLLRYFHAPQPPQTLTYLPLYPKSLEIVLSKAENCSLKWKI